MNNTVYYIKPTNYDFPEVIKDGLIKGLTLIKEKGFSNLKLVLTRLDLLDNAPNHISDALEKIFPNEGIRFTNQLKSQRSFSIPEFPTDEQTTGVNVILANSNPSFSNSNTVVVLLLADYESFNKIQSSLFLTEIDLVAIVYNETPSLNELLSASKAVNFSKNSDSTVIPYVNNLDEGINVILDRMEGINITSPASHTQTRERMESVIDELNRNHISVSYADFLGFLVNKVNFKLKESVNLLNWKHNYFGR